MPSAASSGERWVDFHDVLMHCAYPAFAGDAFTPLFADFVVDTTVASNRAEKVIHVDLRPARERREPPDNSGWTPTFFHGPTQAYFAHGRHRFSDGQSWIEIEPARSQLSGLLFEPIQSELTRAMQHSALSVLLRDHAIFDSHAACACIEGRALVILGDAGAGKTSTLLALLGAGADYMGDDRLLLRRASVGVELLGYPREFHVAPKTLCSHPDLSAEHMPASIDGKVRVSPVQSWPGRFRRRFFGRTVLLAPRIVERPTSSLRLLRGADAFGLLLASAATVVVEALPHRKAQLALLAQLANQATAFELLLGSDFLNEPRQAAARLLWLLSAAHV